MTENIPLNNSQYHKKRLFSMASKPRPFVAQDKRQKEHTGRISRFRQLKLWIQSIGVSLSAAHIRFKEATAEPLYSDEALQVLFGISEDDEFLYEDDDSEYEDGYSYDEADEFLYQMPRTVTAKFAEYDPESLVNEEVKRHPSKPFSSGLTYWAVRRSLWLQGAVSKNFNQKKEVDAKLTLPGLSTLSSTDSLGAVPISPVGDINTKVVDTNDFEKRAIIPEPEKKLSKHEIKQIVRRRVEETSLAKIRITKDSYELIYEKLVLKNRKLRKGRKINLSDLLSIANVGWASTGDSQLIGTRRISNAIYGRY